MRDDDGTTPASASGLASHTLRENVGSAIGGLGAAGGVLAMVLGHVAIGAYMVFASLVLAMVITSGE